MLQTDIKQALLRQGIDSRQLTARVSVNHADWRRKLCQEDAQIFAKASAYTGLAKIWMEQAML